MKNNSVLFSKELTKPQIKKANRIIKLIEELQNEGVDTVIIASPTNGINYYRANKWVDNIEDTEGICNATDFVYSPPNKSGLIDHFGF